MKKRVFLLLSFVITVLLYLLSCTTMKTEWKKAEKANSIEAYEAFSKQYPQSDYSRIARTRINIIREEQDWKKVKQADSWAAYGEHIKSYPKGRHADEARREIAKSYKFNDAEIENIAKLQQEKPDEAKKIEYIDKLIFTCANYLDDNANWIDRIKGRKIYDMLKKYDSQALSDSMIRVVLIQIDRLKVLFLIVKLGVAGTQKPLNDLLMEYGGKSMAEDYLNCGSKELYDGGAAWARIHNMRIISGQGSHRVSWGNF